MPERSRRDRVLDALVLVSAFAFAALYARGTASRIGPAFDETTYVAEGLAVFRTGSHAGLLKLGTMPLPVDVATLPLALAEKLGGGPFDPRSDLDVLLPLARAGALPFLAILLGAGMRLGRRAGGPWGGRLAALLLAAEPAILAHGSLATTDVAVSGLLLGQLDAFLSGRGGRWPRRVGLPALWAAGSLLAKASAVAFGPVLLLAGELHRLRVEGRLPSLRSVREALRPFGRDLAQVALLALLGALLYCGSDFRPERSFLAWAERQDGSAGTAAQLVARNLRVFPNALGGVARQLKHDVLGHGVYLLGETHRRAVPWYFPVALALKLSPGVLLGLALLLVAVAAAAAVTAAGAREMRPGRRALLVALAALLPLSSLAASVRVFPDALCYANVLAGGTGRGHLALSDSNHDWGQGLPALRRLAAERGVASLDVWYFGTDPAAERAPFRRVDLLAPPRSELAEVAASLSGDLLAAGTTLVHGACFPEPLPPLAPRAALPRTRVPHADVPRLRPLRRASRGRRGGGP